MKKESAKRINLQEVKRNLRKIKSPGQRFAHIRTILERNGGEIPEGVRRNLYSMGAAIIDSECKGYASQDQLHGDFNFMAVPDARLLAAEYWEKAKVPRKAAEDYLLTWDKADKAVEIFVQLGELGRAKRACVVAGSSTPVKKFLLERGHSIEAAEAFEELARDRPLQGEYASMAADLWVKIGNDERAIRDYDMASESFYKSSSTALGDRYRLKAQSLRGKAKGLEKATATASIVGILGGIFFLSTNITGNAIADMTTKTTSFLGAGLLIVGLVAGFFWLKGRKPKRKK